MTDKISIPTLDFNNAVSAIEKFIPNTTPINSLKNIHFRVFADGITLTASDSVVMASATIKMNMPFELESFTVLVDAQRMVKFVQSIDTDEIYLEPDFLNRKIVLRVKGRRTTLNTSDPSDYIKVDFDEPEKRIVIDAETFSNATKLMSGYHLPYNDPKMSIWRGVELLVSSYGFRLTATDSFIGTVYQFGKVDDANKILVMGDQLIDVARVSGNYENFEIGVPDIGDTKLFLYGDIGNVSVKTSIQVLDMADQYPDMRGYFDNTNNGTMKIVSVDKSSLANAIKPADPYDSDKMSVFLDRNDRIRLIIEDDQLGEYAAEVEVVSSDVDSEDPILFGINKKFLKKAIGNIANSSNVDIYVSNNAPIAMFFPDSDDDNEYYCQVIAKIV